MTDLIAGNMSNSAWIACNNMIFLDIMHSFLSQFIAFSTPLLEFSYENSNNRFYHIRIRMEFVDLSIILSHNVTVWWRYWIIAGWVDLEKGRHRNEWFKIMNWFILYSDGILGIINIDGWLFVILWLLIWQESLLRAG